MPLKILKPRKPLILPLHFTHSRTHGILHARVKSERERRTAASILGIRSFPLLSLYSSRLLSLPLLLLRIVFPRIPSFLSLFLRAILRARLLLQSFSFARAPARLLTLSFFLVLAQLFLSALRPSLQQQQQQRQLLRASERADLRDIIGYGWNEREGVAR